MFLDYLAWPGRIQLFLYSAGSSLCVVLFALASFLSVEWSTSSSSYAFFSYRFLMRTERIFIFQSWVTTHWPKTNTMWFNSRGNKGGKNWPKDKMHRHTSHSPSRSGFPSFLGESSFLTGRVENLDTGLRSLQDRVAELCLCVPAQELTWHHFFFPVWCWADANSQPPSVGEAGEAFVTLVTSHAYCMGAVVVARSLRRHGTTRSLVVMVTPNVSEQSRWATRPFGSPGQQCYVRLTNYWDRFTPSDASSAASSMRSSQWMEWKVGTVCACPLWGVLS